LITNYNLHLEIIGDVIERILDKREVERENGGK